MIDKKISQLTALLEDFKAHDIAVISVPEGHEISAIIVVTATSKVHGRSIAARLKMAAKQEDLNYLNIEGETSEWALVDLDDVVVHIMSQEVRDTYQLETLWQEIGKSKP